MHQVSSFPVEQLARGPLLAPPDQPPTSPALVPGPKIFALAPSLKAAGKKMAKVVAPVSLVTYSMKCLNQELL